LVASAAVCADVFEALDVACDFALEVALEFEDLEHAAERSLFIGSKFVGFFVGSTFACAQRVRPSGIPTP
jgi:hypothetical protein